MTDIANFLGCALGAALAIASFVVVFLLSAMLVGLWLDTVYVWCGSCR